MKAVLFAALTVCSALAGATDDNELLRNGNFESFVQPPEWFFLAEGADWDGLELASSTAHFSLDETAPHSGKRAMKLWSVGAITVASASIPYPGGSLMLSGWTRATDLKPAARTHGQGAGIQIVGFDSAGRIVAHREAKMLSGSHPWEPFAYTFSLPKEVSTLQVWVRMLQSASGSFGCDDLSLRPRPP